MGDAQALSSSLDDLDRQEDEELIAAATATEGRKLQTAKGKGRASKKCDVSPGKNEENKIWGFARKNMNNYVTNQHGVALKV